MPYALEVAAWRVPLDGPVVAEFHKVPVEADVEASFSRQLVRRYDDPESRQGKWRWVADFLEILP